MVQVLKTKISRAQEAQKKRMLDSTSSSFSTNLKDNCSKSAEETVFSYVQLEPTEEKELQAQERESSVSLNNMKKESDSLKNIAVNYARAIASFAISKLAVPYLETRLQNESLTIKEFVRYVNREKDKMGGICSFSWKEKNEECEDNLLNNRSQEAFNFLKNITKFHEYKRRDGSIIDKIKKEDDSVTTEQNEVRKLVIQNLQKVQTSETEPLYLLLTPFLNLPTLNTDDMEFLLSKVFYGKAIAFDGISDILFSQANKPLTAKKLNNIWSATIADYHFETRLIPLNKVYSNIPTAKDCRPIAVCSALIKLLESRSRRTLENYMIQGLHRGQTCFVPGMSITVNQMRIVQGIKEITGDCFGCFIDFSSAYNLKEQHTINVPYQKMMRSWISWK